MAESDNACVCFQGSKKRALYGFRQSTYILRGEYYNSLRKKNMNTLTNESQEENVKDKGGSKTNAISTSEQAQLDQMEADFNKTREEVESSEDEKADGEEEKRWYEYLIISVDNPLKSNFDIVVLFFVAYSCFASLYSVAFSEPTNRMHIIWD